MTKEPFENPQLLELATWESLIHSDNWSVYRKLLDDHKAQLTKDCLRYVSEANFHNAVRCQAKVEDVGRIKALIDEQLKELRKGAEHGRKE